jgi:cyclase
VISGHGHISSLDDMRVFLKMLKETRAVVQNALKQGKTFEEMNQTKILDLWNKYSGDFIGEEAYLAALYNSLTRRKKR